MSQVRCYDCGREIEADGAVRRDVVVIRGRSAIGLPLGECVSRVDLCRACDRDRARVAALTSRDQAAEMRRAVVAGAVVVGAVALCFALFVLCVAVFGR